MMFAANGENSSPRNSAKVVSCLCGVAAHVPGPIVALKVVGSQLSTNATLGSLLLTWAVATFVKVTHKPTNTASPQAQIANFRMRVASATVLAEISNLASRHQEAYTRLTLLEPLTRVNFRRPSI
jgi:hypothetical protein